jgi:hypothetical protein
VANLPRQTRNVCDRSRDMQKFLRASMLLRETLVTLLAPPLTHSASPSQGYPKLAERVSTPHVSSGSTTHVFFDGPARDKVRHQKPTIDLGLGHRCVLGTLTGCCGESSLVLLSRCLAVHNCDGFTDFTTAVDTMLGAHCGSSHVSSQVWCTTSSLVQSVTSTLNG